MYSFFYILMSLLGTFLIFNKKNNLYYQKLSSLILSNLLIIFFLFNNISADKSYYDSIFLHDYSLGYQHQGYDVFFYYFAHIISKIKNPQVANLILYTSLIYSTYFLSNKFKNPFHIVLLFFPYIFVVVMQGFPRQAWALLFIIIGINFLFYLNKNYNEKTFNKNFIISFIFFFFSVSIFFHYSSVMILGVYILILLTKINHKHINISLIIVLLILLNLFFFDFFKIYIIKFSQHIDFLSTRDDHSLKGFVMRFIIIIIPSILILFFFIKNIYKKKSKFHLIDELFFILSAICLFFMIFLLITPSTIIISDRLNIYFFLITVYFFGRFIYFSFLKRISNYFILFSIFYLNGYLLLWTLYSKSYYEFKYNFELFNHYPITNFINQF